MPYSQSLIEELNVLALFNLENLQEGIKVHHEAGAGKVEATERLFKKGLITQHDGGYLTQLGIDAAEHSSTLLLILETESAVSIEQL